MWPVIKTLSVISVSLVCIIGVTWGFILKDKPLQPQVQKAFETMQRTVELPAEKNRLYFLIGFDLPPTFTKYYPKIFSEEITTYSYGKKWLDAQIAFYQEPENFLKKFMDPWGSEYLIQQILPEAVGSRIVDNKRSLFIKEGYSSLVYSLTRELMHRDYDKTNSTKAKMSDQLSTAGNLFRKINESGFILNLFEWYTCFFSTCTEDEEFKGRSGDEYYEAVVWELEHRLARSKAQKNIFIQRYIQLRQIKQSSHIVIKSPLAQDPQKYMEVIKAHQLYLLDLLARFVNAENHPVEQNAIIRELAIDLTDLQEWYTSTETLINLMLVQRMLLDDMQAGTFLLKEARKTNIIFSNKEKLVQAFADVETTFLSFVPQRVIFNEGFFTSVYSLDLVMESKNIFSAYTISNEDVASVFGQTVINPWYFSASEYLPEVVYKGLMYLFLKRNNSVNELYEAYAILLSIKPFDEESREKGLEKIRDMMRSSRTWQRLLYNPVGTLFLSQEVPEDSVQILPAFLNNTLQVANLLYRQQTITKVQEYNKQVRDL